MIPARFRIPLHTAGAWALAALLVVSAGCATGPAKRPEGFGKSPTVGTMNSSEGLREARVLVEAGDYTAAIPRLLHILTKGPETPAAVEAKYWLGFAYYGTSSYRDALLEFEEYLYLAPGGPYAAEAQAFVDRIRADYRDIFITPQDLDSRIDAARGEASNAPGDEAKQLELAELLWRRGDYDAAGTIYRALLRNNPNLAGQPPVDARMEYLPTGQWLVLTPAEIERRSIEERPLDIVNVNGFRSGEDLFTREKRFYVVTGQAHNRSDSVLYNVRVDVTIYGFGNVVFDTTSVNFNRLNPGEKRAFSVRFGNFDNINNIVRHECAATFGN